MLWLVAAAAAMPGGAPLQPLEPLPESVAGRCLAMSHDKVGKNLSYPFDAEEHFQHLHRELFGRFGGWDHPGNKPIFGAPEPNEAVYCWGRGSNGTGRFSGMCAPDYERMWHAFGRRKLFTEGQLENDTLASGPSWPLVKLGRPLGETFRGFVPLFVPWFSMNYLHCGTTLFRVLQELLRPDVAYVTVSFHDVGLRLNPLPNLLVLGMGGFAHVPLPEINPHIDTVEAVPYRKLGAAGGPWQQQDLSWKQQKRFTNRSYLVSFLGSTNPDPEQVNDQRSLFRRAMCDRVEQYAADCGDCFRRKLCTTADNYTEYAYASTVTLCPRGYGRNSMRLGEILQARQLPIAVYDDLSFVPYASLFKEIGWVSSISELPKLLETLRHTPEEEFQRRQARLTEVIGSHFSPAGVMRQVELFFRGEGDLRCQPMPKCPSSDCVYRNNSFTCTQRDELVDPVTQCSPGKGWPGNLAKAENGECQTRQQLDTWVKSPGASPWS